MTFFTIDTDPEQKFLNNDRVSQVCLTQLRKLLKDTDIEFKIFTPKDKIVQDCLSEFSNYFKYVKEEFPTESAPYEADLIRIYILSKNKNYLYLDSDMYLKNLDIVKFLGKEAKNVTKFCFAGLWSGEHPEVFDAILDYYKEINDNGYQYIIEKYGMLRNTDYMSDAAAYINSGCNLEAFSWEELSNSSIFHFPSFIYQKGYKYYVCSEEVEEKIKSCPNIWNSFKEQKIKIICKNFPWFEWEKDPDKNEYVCFYVISYGVCFEKEEFLKLFRELFPDYEII